MKIFKNYIETFENIRKYSKVFYLYAHLIDFLRRSKKSIKNPKYEARNSKQIRITKIRNSKQEIATKKHKKHEEKLVTSSHELTRIF
jgi:ABC-type amino acid transport system permease subunit